MEGNNAELMQKIVKMEENETLKAEKSQQKPVGSSIVNPISQSSDENVSSKFSLLDEKPKIKRSIPNPNCLIDTFAWINRKEMADSSLSTSSEKFRQYCWPKLHQNIKPYKISNLKICKSCDRLGNERIDIQIDGKSVPITTIPSPSYIVGIKRIEITESPDYGPVMNFVENIAHLLQNCNFCFQTRKESLKYYCKSDIIVTQKFFEYLADKIFKFEFSSFDFLNADEFIDVLTSTRTSTNLNEFNEHFPGILDRLNFLSLKGTRDLDNGGIDILINWLTKQQTNNDGKQQQKIIELRNPNDHEFKTIYSRIKEKFFHSNLPSTFLISFYTDRDRSVGEFVQENVRTNEILASYRKQDYYYLARYPKGEEHWKEDGENKIHQVRDSTTIYLNNILSLC